MNENKELTPSTADISFPIVEVNELNKITLHKTINDVFSDPDSFKKKFVLKPSVTIAISGDLSAPARKIFSLLYAHAFDNIEALKHIIALPTLLEALDDTIHDYARLRSHLVELVETSVQWNILEKDNRIWGAAALLANIEINEEAQLVQYAIAEQLQHPESMMPYAKLDIALQNRLNSVNSLTLYELLTDYYSDKFGKGETPWIPISILQKLLGTNYSSWANIKRKLIHEPLARLKDLDFSIEVQQQKRGRKVVAVKFVMTRKKEKTAKAAPAQLPMPNTTTFAQLRISQLYRIVGGTGQVFVKTSDTTAQNVETKKPVTMTNLDAAVEVLSNRKP